MIIKVFYNVFLHSNIKVSLENGICDEILKCKDIIPKPSFDSPTSSYRHNNENLSEEDLQLRLMHDLIQGSIQRCRCSVEQLEEAKTAMFKVNLFQKNVSRMNKRRRNVFIVCIIQCLADKSVKE